MVRDIDLCHTVAIAACSNFFYEGLHKLAATLEHFFDVPPYFLEVLPQGQEPRLGLLAATSFSCL